MEALAMRDELKPMAVEDVTDQVALIQRVMQAAMKEGEHYGTIPGTQKPTLLKPGAEKLCLTFRFDPEYEVESAREKDFIAHTVRCTLSYIPTGQRVASGFGACNSREEKYKWRTVATDEPVPKDYWAARTNGDIETMREILGADGSTKKKDGQWFIARRMQNDNPWELDNTILKMACKRALVAAVLNATAASDIFTQDLEDMDEFKNGNDKKNPSPKKSAPKKSTPKKKTESVDKETGEVLQDEAVQKYLEWPEEKIEEINGGFDILGYPEEKRLEIIKCFDNPDSLLTELNARVDSLG